MLLATINKNFIVCNKAVNVCLLVCHIQVLLCSQVHIATLTAKRNEWSLVSNTMLRGARAASRRC